MVICLNNIDDLEMIMLKHDNASSIDDLIARKLVKSSLEAKEVEGFKEISNINNISFGHFILIEKILELDIDETEKLKMICPILFRPLDEEKLDNEDREKEEEHKQLVINTVPIGAVYNRFNEFMKLRHEYLYKTYNGVIYGTLDDAENDEEEKKEGTNINGGTSARQFHTKKFFWQSLISTIAGGDIFKFNKAVDLMMYTVMPFLAEKRSLEIVEYLEHKANMK